MNLPNKLTMGRIIAIPVFIIVFLMGHAVTATIIFIAAAATDALDGHIARKRGLVTNFGKLMDPLADKLLTMSAFLVLVGEGTVASWICSHRSASDRGGRWRGYGSRYDGQGQDRAADGGDPAAASRQLAGMLPAYSA